MKHAAFLLSALLLLALAACGRGSQEQGYYTKYENLVDPNKPIAFGEDYDVYIFAGQMNRERAGAILDSTLTRTVILTAEEQYFYPIYKGINEIDAFSAYKNLIFCGTLEGTDEVSAYMRRTLAPNLVETARQSGSELFVVNNLHVRDQLILYLLARDGASLEALARQRADQVFDYLLQRYSQRLAYQAYKSEVVADKFFADRPFAIQVPVLYKIYRDDKPGRFLSFIYQPTRPTRAKPDKYISVYHEPMETDAVDAAWLYVKRQELGKKYFNGDEILDNKYTSAPVQIAGQNGVTLYGHWINKTLGGGVGGAFQSYAFWHAPSKTAYLVDTIAYYPDGNKLPVLLELGMLARSISVK